MKLAPIGLTQAQVTALEQVAATGAHPLASLAKYDRESLLEKSKAGQLLAAAQGKHIGRPKGLDAENLAKVKKHWKRAAP